MNSSQLTNLDIRPVKDRHTGKTLQDRAIFITKHRKIDQQSGHQRFGTARCAVIALQRNSEPGMRHSCTEYTFGTGLHKRAGHGGHQIGAEPIRAGNHERMCPDRRYDPIGRCAAFVAHTLTAGEPGKSRCPRTKRKGPCRH